MAGEWIKFEASTPDKPEVFAITVAMGWDDPDLTVGKLLRVWKWFDQQTIDGNAPNVTLALLDRISSVTGFAQAMCNVGWLVSDEQGLHLPHFDRHNGKTAKDRALTAKRVAIHKNKETTNDESNDDIVSSPLPKEEKRREEKSKQLTDTNVSVVASDADNQILVHERKKTERVDCPHKDIVALYHELCPQLPAVRDWSAARQEQLRTRWNEDPARQNLNYWRGFFQYVAANDFLTGKSYVQAGKRPFIADLEWLTKSANFIKIREGKYDN